MTYLTSIYSNTSCFLMASAGLILKLTKPEGFCYQLTSSIKCDGMVADALLMAVPSETTSLLQQLSFILTSVHEKEPVITDKFVVNVKWSRTLLNTCYCSLSFLVIKWYCLFCIQIEFPHFHCMDQEAHKIYETGQEGPRNYQESFKDFFFLKLIKVSKLFLDKSLKAQKNGVAGEGND